jgi:photosystem II stability/assembly factor-like uncharacterized protein
MKARVMILFLLGFLTGQAQSQWFYQNPLPQPNTLSHMRFVDDSTGFAFGDCGIVLKTTDGGFSWRITGTDETMPVAGVSFPCHDTGYIISEYVMKTTDCGEHWDTTSLYSGTIAMWGIVDISFVTGYKGYAINEEGIYKTTDGGITWSFKDPGATRALVCVCFPVMDTGFIGTGGGKIIRTTDAGNSWSIVLYVPGQDIVSVSFANGLTGFAIALDDINDTYVYRTEDGGASWQLMKHFPGQYLDMYLMNDSALWISGTTRVARTSDKGLTWEDFLTDKWIRSPAFRNSLTGYAVGQFNGGFCPHLPGIFKTEDGGSTWQEISHVTSVGSATFLDNDFPTSLTGYTVGRYYKNYTETGGIICKTQNGGAHWDTLVTTPHVLNACLFLNDTLGFVCGNNGEFFKTTDGGSTWLATIIDPDVTLQSLFFLNADTGFAGGRNDTASWLFRSLYKTVDGGNSWASLIKNQTGDVRVIDFPTPDTGYILSCWRNGNWVSAVLKTTDAGLTWTSMTDMWGELQCMQFVSAQEGFAAGSVATIGSAFLKTMDAGVTWIADTVVPRDSYILGMAFSDPFTGYLVGAPGLILYTVDQGETWTPLATHTCEGLESICMFNSDTGYLCGSNSILMSTLNNGGLPVTVKPQAKSTSEPLLNFPNPFSCSTRITYRVDHEEMVLLTVYNFLGQPVETLVNSVQQAGKYEIPFDSKGLPQGLYIYRLQTGSRVSMGKMILSR